MRELTSNIIQFIVSKYILISATILIMITILSLTPLSELPEVPGGDKLHHLAAYAALIFPVALARPKHWLLIALVFVAWSGAIELIQPYVNRYGEWADMLANTCGLIIGIMLTNLLHSNKPIN